jgi:acyl-[acyl-carrier-protein]-phospholipid O-acyltransferase/long-chain-fatty-acid--[acyl-carrier-protein] ligase
MGIGVGSLMAGSISKRSIEFGVVPVGALTISASCFLLGVLGQGEFFSAALLCVLLGTGAGLFIVPVESFIQYRTPPERRGEVIAAAGWLAWCGILVASALVYILPTLGLDSAGGFVATGILVLGLFGFAMWKLPDFLIRFFAMLLTRFYYRLSVDGQENVPAQGSALIVANHASLIDASCLLASQPRRIRFLMDRQYIQRSNLFMRALFRLMQVIPVSEKDTPREIIKSLQEARRALAEGWLVGIFPEGTLSRTGHMLDFKRGYQKIIKGTGAEIVPTYIDGVFGTRSSYAVESPVAFSWSDFRRSIGMVFGAPVGESTEPQDLQNLVQGLADQASMLRSWDSGSVGAQIARSCRANWSKNAISDSTGKSLTYGDILTAVLILLPAIHPIAGGRGKVVGVMLPPSAAGVLVNLCLAMGRMVSANLNYTSSKNALRAAVDISGMDIVITSRAFVEKTGVEIEGVEIYYLEDLVGKPGLWAKAEAYFRARFLPIWLLTSQEGWGPDELLTVLFSSGSTSTPKAIALSHRNISSNIDAFSSVARTRSEDCLLGVLPFFHSMGYTTTLLFPILKGISARYHHHPMECEQIEKLCKAGKVTIVIGTPTFMLGWARKIKPDSLRHLRWAVAGAEKLRPRVADIFHERFGIRPMEGYGATECSPVISINVPDVDLAGVKQAGCREGTAGRPLPNVLCRIVDPETGEAVGRGMPGLLLVKAPSVMLGYLGDEDRTREVLKDGWYTTGDVAILDREGFLTITDRISRFSKIGGEMISHTAVEECIKTAAKDALDSKSVGLVVTAKSDEKKGERLVVIFELGACDLQKAQDAVRVADIPNLWKPAPQNWRGVEKIPVLGTGKLDLSAIKALASDS